MTRTLRPTDRELEVLRAVTEPGATYETAAQSLGISTSTVRGTLRLLYVRLGVRSAGQAWRAISEQVA